MALSDSLDLLRRNAVTSVEPNVFVIWEDAKLSNLSSRSIVPCVPSVSGCGGTGEEKGSTWETEVVPIAGLEK